MSCEARVDQGHEFPGRKNRRSTVKDNWNREINYIRISVTDRCNLRCVITACRRKASPAFSHSEVLSLRRNRKACQDMEKAWHLACKIDWWGTACPEESGHTCPGIESGLWNGERDTDDQWRSFKRADKRAGGCRA